MNNFISRVLDLHGLQTALRGDCGVLAERLTDPNLQRLIADLRGQHARQTAELAAMLAEAADGAATPAEPDAVAGDEHATAIAASDQPDAAHAQITSVVRAEGRLARAYERAAEEVDVDSPAHSLLCRHLVALKTSQQRLQLVANAVLN
jgi:hypothetical protein